MTSFFELKRQLCPSTRVPEIAVDNEPAVGENIEMLRCQANPGPVEGAATALCEGRPWISKFKLERL